MVVIARVEGAITASSTGTSLAQEGRRIDSTTLAGPGVWQAIEARAPTPKEGQPGTIRLPTRSTSGHSGQRSPLRPIPFSRDANASQFESVGTALLGTMRQCVNTQSDRANGCHGYENGAHHKLILRDRGTVHPIQERGEHQCGPATELHPPPDLRRGKLGLFVCRRLIVHDSDCTRDCFQRQRKSNPPPRQRHPLPLNALRHMTQRCQHIVSNPVAVLVPN